MFLSICHALSSVEVALEAVCVLCPIIYFFGYYLLLLFTIYNDISLPMPIYVLFPLLLSVCMSTSDVRFGNFSIPVQS